MRHRSLAALAITALAALTLTACVSGTTSDADPDGVETPDSGETEAVVIDAAWLDGGRVIGIVTEGSSTCVPQAGDVGVEGSSLTVTLVAPEASTPCTMDLVPRVTLVDVPAMVDPSSDLQITVTGDELEGQVTLPGIAGLSVDGPSELLPSAGWTTTGGTFIVLLYGSSGCPEYITDTEVTGEAAVTASLSGIPADKVCTADYAPNPQVAVADGLADVADVQLTLTGPTAEPVTVPMLGVSAPAE